MKNSLLLALLLLVGLNGTASAAPPALHAITTTEDRHPAATFAAPGADSATIYFATAPDRATDGRFLEENVHHLDFLTNEEVQAGRWTGEDRLDPGHYWVQIRASDYDCTEGQPCTEGSSNLLEVDVLRPEQDFIGRAEVLRYVRVVWLTLRASPAGRRTPYRVCWRTARRKLRCVRSEVTGDWDSPSRDLVRIRLRGLARGTTFTWIVGGEVVDQRRVRTVPG